LNQCNWLLELLLVLILLFIKTLQKLKHLIFERGYFVFSRRLSSSNTLCFLGLLRLARMVIDLNSIEIQIFGALTLTFGVWLINFELQDPKVIVDSMKNKNNQRQKWLKNLHLNRLYWNASIPNQRGGLRITLIMICHQVIHNCRARKTINIRRQNQHFLIKLNTLIDFRSHGIAQLRKSCLKLFLILQTFYHGRVFIFEKANIYLLKFLNLFLFILVFHIYPALIFGLFPQYNYLWYSNCFNLVWLDNVSWVS